MVHKKIIYILAFFLAVSMYPLVSAANVGVSPANIEFFNVLRGGYAERPIIITIDAEKDSDVQISTWGTIADWIELSQEQVTISRGSPHQLLVAVRPPSDTPNGNYTGFIRISGSRLADPVANSATGLILPTLDLFITVQVTDQEFLDCRASSFSINSAEEGEDIIFQVDILNEGNIRFSPQITFDVWDQESINLVKQVTYSQTEITPTKEETVIVKIPSNDMELGQYWVDVSVVECFNEQTLTFDVLEEGSLRASGILERISVPVWVDKDDIVPIEVRFRNNGEKSLDARFSGKVLFQNKIVQLLESDQDLFVPLEEEDSFQFFFTPRQAGKYIISGRVFYDGKRTYEKSAVLNVRPTGGVWDAVIRITLYAILLIIIAILIYKIRNERRSYVRRLRQIR